MKLIGTPTSPYVRKVRIVLAEKKMEYEFIVDAPSQEGSRVPLLNPLGRIPVLLLDEETPIYDSRVIVEHIDNVTPNNKLLPGPNRERTEIKRWEALADGLCDAAVAILLESRRPKKEQSASWIQRQRDVVTRSLAALEVQVGEKAFCTGMHFSLADIAVGTALGYLCFRFPEITWQENHPNLSRLHDKLMQRPSFIDTVPHD
ncbi:glutathione S-transferase N-terminal domain-containing protein [Azonexus sp.]|uniref:glutathione S-transferase N-terminal domain-containing protein n=1 Tax=Azonexus sp. TaxID=1872668 RepID=UPI0027BB19C9|nr:glutathione S-transferase N-terminal domain-containing protein [Azonexus sp.]